MANCWLFIFMKSCASLAIFNGIMAKEHGGYSCSVNAKSLQSCQLFANLWTVAHQAPLSMGILQAKILEWVTMPASRGSSQTWGSNPHLICLLHWQAASLPLVPPGASLVAQMVKSQCLGSNPISATYIFGTVSQLLHHSIPQSLIYKSECIT